MEENVTPSGFLLDSATELLRIDKNRLVLLRSAPVARVERPPLSRGLGLGFEASSVWPGRVPVARLRSWPTVQPVADFPGRKARLATSFWVRLPWWEPSIPTLTDT